MKKKGIMIVGAVLVLSAVFLFMLFRQKPFAEQFQQQVNDLNSYLLKGTMDIVRGEETKTYDVSVKYLKDGEQEYFRVSLNDRNMDQEQEIIRNDTGVYVVTPALNQIFQFKGNWPTNSLKPYLLQSISEILKGESVQVEEKKDGYQVTAEVTYPNNKDFVQQEMFFSEDAKLQSLEIFNKDHVSQLKMIVSQLDYDPGLKKNDFTVPQQLEKSTAAQTVQEADLPLLPMETFGAVLTNRSVMQNDAGVTQHILEYSGDKSFTIVEQLAQSEETTRTVIMSGTLMDSTLLVGRYDGNHLSVVDNQIQYTIYSEDLSEEEMVQVLQSMQVVVMK